MARQLTRLLLDSPAARRLVHIGTQYYQDTRNYYLAEPDCPFLLVARNGLDPLALAGRTVDARVGWEDGFPGFCYEHHIGLRMIKVTIYRVLDGHKPAETTLSAIMTRAGRRVST